jgi:hypothetical protein
MVRGERRLRLINICISAAGPSSGRSGRDSNKNGKGASGAQIESSCIQV